MKIEQHKITRVEIIDHRGESKNPGRVFSARECSCQLSVQDEGRTLKVFVDSQFFKADNESEGRE